MSREIIILEGKGCQGPVGLASGRYLVELCVQGILLSEGEFAVR